jgi:Flp pilus assembly protein TadD
VALTVTLWIADRNLTSATVPPFGPIPGTPVEDSVGGSVPTPPSLASTFEARVATLEAHVASAPEDRGLRLALARLLHDGHREREAVEHYREALAMDPEDARIYFDLAAAYGAQGDWAGAEEVLAARLEMAPSDAMAMYNLGAVQANRGDVAAAESWWRKAAAAAEDETLAASAAHALARIDQARSQ